MPFNNLNINEYVSFAKYDVIETRNGANIKLTPTASQQVVINKLNDLITQANTRIIYDDESEYDGPEFDQPLSCSYYSCEDFVKAKFESFKKISILHVNIHSIQLHIEELRVLLDAIDYKFDVIAISESKLKNEPTTDITLSGFHPPHCKYTEAEKGGTILYISDKLNYKPRKDLEIYASKELESSFVEIVNKKSSNDVVGVIYRHPKLNPNDFTENKLTQIFDKLAKENNKKVYIAGDFNFDLLKYSVHGDTADFFDKMTSNLLVPLILVPTKINSKNDTLIDNIFTNQFNSETVSGNLTVNFSDGHLPSFAIFPKPNQNHLPKRHNLYSRDIKNMDTENFLLDVAALDMDAEIIVDNDGERSLDNLLTKINNLIDKYAPLKKITRAEFKQTRKPWITNGILTSIRNKDKLYHKYIKTKEPNARAIIHTEYKLIKNRINVLIHYSKKDYYSKYFNQYSNDIKKVWQGIKGIINIKTKDQNSPNCIEVKKELITDNTQISNEFNDYFSNVADNILKTNKTPILNTFDRYLKNRNSSSFAFDPCTPNEVFLLIAGLNSSKGTGPNGIPTEILKMINYIICNPLSKIINICIRTGVHPEKLKLAHVIPIFKKGCRLQVSNYRPISLLSNINKIFEKIMHKRVYSFLEKFNLLYKLQFGFRSKHSTSHALIHMTEAI